MKHFMLDMYGIKTDTESADRVNEIINEVINKLSLKAIMPVINFPYYYGTPAEDGGVSSICLLDNGHITVHTFPFYEICYVDIMFSEIDNEKALKVFSEIFKPTRYDTWCFDRDTDKCLAPYDDINGFGPHLLVKANAKNNFSIGDIYELLETIPDKIGMHNIMRPIVATNKIYNHTVISGLTVIAESHISFHFNEETKQVYFDIYSCKFCDPQILFDITEELFGKDCEYQLVSRGKKLENPLMKGYLLSDNGWKANI